VLKNLDSFPLGDLVPGPVYLLGRTPTYMIK
jgi:hypothetical protein